MARLRVLGIAIVAILLISGACTGSTHVASTSPQPSPTPAGPRMLCFASAPADWSAAISEPIATLNGVNFSPGAVDDVNGVAYGYFAMASKQGVAAVDLKTGKMSVVSLMTASESGVASIAYAGGWLVWAQGESHESLGMWTIQAWNAATHEKKQIASSRLLDGTYLDTQLVFPAIWNGYVAWNQPLTRDMAQLRVYELATGRLAPLDSGRVSSPVIAGGYLVWAKLAPNATNPSLVFADAATLMPVSAPPELKDPRQIGYLAGSPDYLVWTGTPTVLSPDNGTLFVDDLARGLITTYGARDHYFQFPQLAGPLLVWFGSVKSSVVDLRSGSGFDVPISQQVTAAGDTLVVTTLSGAATKGSIGSTAVSVLHPSRLQPLASCPV